MGLTFQPRPCPSCESGVIALRDAKGQTLPYKDSPGVTIVRSVLVPLCDQCGEMLIDEPAAAAMDEALEAAYVQQRR